MVNLVLQEMTLKQIMSGICKIVTIMKKIMKPFVLVAAAAMALASCQKNEMPAPAKQDVHFTINAGIETKTSIVETPLEDGNIIYKAQWDGNEELGVLFAAPGKDTEAKDVAKLTNAESGKVASFQGNVTVEGAAGTFYAFYPASAFNRGYEEGDARLDLKNVQKPTAKSFDPTCDILVAKPYDYTVEDGAVVAEGLEFARIMSVLRIDLKSDFADVQNEFVESVSFTAGDVKITGYARIFLENPEFTGNWASTEQKYCTVTANYDSDLVSINGTSNSVYLVIAPVTIPANKDLTFEIKTKNYKISKTVKSPEMKFTAGKVSKINLAIASDNCEKVDLSVDYSGEYLILGDNSGTKYAAVKHDGSSNNLKGVALTLEGDKVLEFDGMADSKMVVTKVVGGTYDGLYTIMDASGKYLYAASSSGNQLKSAALSTSTPQHYYWSIVEKEGVYEIIASKSANRNVMQFNYNNGSPIFNCYSSASQKAVALYAYSDIKPDTTPKISVTNAAYSVKATDTSVEIPYTVKNITDAISASVADGASMSNVSANVTEGKVTVSFAANEESAEKTATIVLSYEGAQSVNVVITQAGKPADDDQPTDGPLVWTLVTNVSDLAVGDEIIIAAKDYNYALGAASSNGNNRTQVAITKSDDTLTSIEGATVLTLQSGTTSGSYSLFTGSKYLYAASSSSNNLKEKDNKDDNGSWKITISTDGTASLVAQGTYTRNTMQYNQSSGLFACYSSASQKALAIYKQMPSSGDVGGTTPDPDQPGDSGDDEPESGMNVILSEEFDNTSNTDESSAITATTFSNFSGSTDKAYKSQYGGIKLGSSKASGYITSKSLDLSSTFTVQIDACKYSSDTGNIVVTVGSQTQTISNSQLGAAGTFKTFTLTFEAATTSSTVKIATSSKRAYIDNVVITRN